MKNVSVDRYAPIRKGDIYCSPGCGARCTYAAYLLAKRRAKKLCTALGPGWEPHVWDNLGWHYCAELPEERTGIRAEIHGKHYPIVGSADFSVFFGPKHLGTADSPEAAAQLIVDDARNTVRALLNVVAATSHATPLLRELVALQGATAETENAHAE